MGSRTYPWSDNQYRSTEELERSLVERELLELPTERIKDELRFRKSLQETSNDMDDMSDYDD